ncbi:hypothetical protein [Bacillus cereus]|uniref:hypothetical protein n=1 Tax=Bacillus cereus TaxID=1396 RepID=UPI000BED9A3B|nr:hypothetical protein [Bacillus cereus]PED34163.1 hypothetical protein CON13_00160 [Bacillus cereus]PEE49576.1 hypothetical protein COM80_30140 [Bacillus cereus]PFL90307.1 hypothetical protein COJ35_25830 [Bacillus cereus]PFV62734.1 hypothetical protein COL16_29695 [Bacillus cereus]PGS36817.1 hypothetical protein COC56_10295 [Bacillus cereus]
MSQNNKFTLDEDTSSFNDIISKPKSLDLVRERKNSHIRLVTDNHKTSNNGSYYTQTKEDIPYMKKILSLTPDEHLHLINSMIFDKKQHSYSETDNTFNNSKAATETDINSTQPLLIQNQQEDTKKILEALDNINLMFREVSATTPNFGSNNGGNGGDMGMLERRVENLEKKTEQIERLVHDLNHKMTSVEVTLRSSSTKEDIQRLEINLAKTITEAIKPLPKEDTIKNMINDAIKPLPTENTIKTIIRDVNKSDDIASNAHVEAAVTKSRNTVITWAFGIMVAAATAIIKFIK